MSSLPLDLYVVTFNCGRALLDIEAFAATLFRARTDHASLPDIVVLSLQEVSSIAYSFLGGALLAPYFGRFVEAVQLAGGGSHAYRHLITHNVGMTGIVVLAKPEISANIEWLQTAETGVGWYEMGNKGAAAIRLGYKADDMQYLVPLTLVAAHLAPAEDAWQRRNEDWENIVRRLAFKSPHTNTASLSQALPKDANDEEEPLLGQPTSNIKSKRNVQSMFTSGSPIFLAGDLNYRSSDVGPQPEEHETFPQPVESEAHPQHWSQLFKSDQLNREREAGRTLHDLKEASVSFPPTYKFSEKQQESMTKDQFMSEDAKVSKWLWSSHRFPSWCDRVLFSSGLKPSNDDSDCLTKLKYKALSIQPTSDHRPVALSCRLDLVKAQEVTSNQTAPFPLLDGWEGRRNTARREEIAVGLASYLGLTWEGNGLLLASLFGVVGGWWVLGSVITAT